MDIVNTPVNTGFVGGANIASANSISKDMQQSSRNELNIQADTQKDEQTRDKPTQNVSDIVQANSSSADNLVREEQSQAIEVAVKEVESFLQVQNRNLSFSIDDKTDRSVVTVKDSSSGDVIRQIPSEEVLQLAERIKSLQEDIGSSVGVFINNKV